MSDNTKSKYKDYKGKLYFARLFESNKDDSEYHEKTEGQYNCVFVPESEEVLDKMKSDGIPEVSMGHPQFKPTSAADDAIGIKLKRPHVHPKIEDFGGAPEIFDWTDGVSDKKWDLDVDGEIGNGTEVQVKVSIYTPTNTIRLEKVAILVHVPYESSEYAEVGW